MHAQFLFHIFYCLILIFNPVFQSPWPWKKTIPITSWRMMFSIRPQQETFSRNKTGIVYSEIPDQTENKGHKGVRTVCVGNWFVDQRRIDDWTKNMRIGGDNHSSIILLNFVFLFWRSIFVALFLFNPGLMWRLKRFKVYTMKSMNVWLPWKSGESNAEKRLVRCLFRCRCRCFM